MKKKHFYVFTGINKEQAVAWRDELRDDLIIFENDNLVIPVISLSWLEAVKMKFWILCSNIRSHYGFGLVRI